MKNTGCFTDFLKYSTLNVLGMIGLSCYILADTFFISKALGADGLAALNLAIPIYSFIHGSGLMIGMGSATKYSILLSQKETTNANQIFTNAVVFTIALALLFFCLGALGAGTIVRALGADDTIYPMSRTYLQVILLFAPMFMFNNLLLCFVRNDGAPQHSMAAMIGGSLSNVVLDYVFMFPLQMGMFGAALATGLAPVISMMILSPFFLRKKNHFHLTRCRLSVSRIIGICSSGLPSLITEVSSGIVILVFNMLILRIEGNLGVAAYGVIANLSLVVMAIFTGIAQGIQPILSRNYGMRNSENVQAILRYAITAMLMISACIYACVFFMDHFIVGIFNSQNDALLQSIAETGLKFYFTACAFAGFNIIISVYFTSTEHPRPAHLISLLRGFGIIIPMAFFLSSVGGMIGVWCAFPATEFLVCLLAIALLLFRRKKKRCG